MVKAVSVGLSVGTLCWLKVSRVEEKVFADANA
jgi:hypothetical protein